MLIEKKLFTPNYADLNRILESRLEKKESKENPINRAMFLTIFRPTIIFRGGIKLSLNLELQLTKNIKFTSIAVKVNEFKLVILAILTALFISFIFFAIYSNYFTFILSGLLGIIAFLILRNQVVVQIEKYLKELIMV
ncbi:MAG: hypothetical protein IT222_10010 [Crocinitomix sp.]|nr:hypothetical protein [Crocinitomix sp.]